MSTHAENEKAQDLEPEAASGGAPAQEDPQRKLPPELWIRVINVQAGDSHTLVSLCRQYPDFIEAILAQASSSAGSQAVQQAVTMLSSNPTSAAPAGPVRGRPMQYDYSVEGFKYDESVLTLEGGDIVGDHLKFITMYPELRSKVLNGIGMAHPELFDELLDRLHAREKAATKGPSEKELTEAQDSGGSETRNEANSESESQERSARPAEPTKEAAWITGAKRFNAAHEEEVNEFNRVTNDSCLGPDGKVDPALVSDWQARHGVQPDGRVGPATVDAARRAAGIGRPPAPMTQEDLESLE